jgi:hypothetical protein
MTDNTASSVTNLEIGPSAIAAYSRLSYTMWSALAEFVDNSTQSRLNYESIIDEVLASEGNPLKVEIAYDRTERVITITDNSIGMTQQRLIDALKVAQKTRDSVGRSRYGMGLKTAACWIGNRWSVTTCEFGSGIEWTAEIDVMAVAGGKSEVLLVPREVSRDLHYTRIRIWDLNRGIQKRTEENIKIYLGSMYRVDIRDQRLIILVNDDQVPLPEAHDFARTDDGKELREDFETTIGGKQVKGWFGVLKKGGRKLGGFSLMQHDRQIRGYPNAWKPNVVFGGVEDEGSNTLIAQRLTGEIILDGFDVSHTKDAILFRGDEEEKLELFLAEATRSLKFFAKTIRKDGHGTTWSKTKIAELVDGIKDEFNSDTFKDVVNEALIPPLSVIEENNRKQFNAVEDDDLLFEIEDVGAGIRVRVYLQDRTENDPYVMFLSHDNDTLNIVINLRHPYYAAIESDERADELIRQYLYDAVAEYRIGRRNNKVVSPDAVRTLKNQLMIARLTRLETESSVVISQEIDRLSDVGNAE